MMAEENQQKSLPSPPEAVRMQFLDDLKSMCAELETRGRLSWHEYFASLALLVSARSPCQRLHVGCAIVRENRVLCTGYNGFFSGVPHRSIFANGHEQATVHAEQNAVAHAARTGIALAGATAYITHYPCVNCYKTLVAAGISQIFYIDDYRNDEIVAELSTLSRVAVDKLADYRPSTKNNVKEGGQ
mmetsp:Transcript_26014/g.80069  ORF Transcript_26014/g.80069 Transcript_26014/m.80069 type:complete len:187 (+) Transcript_26014:72-632(+)